MELTFAYADDIGLVTSQPAQLQVAMDVWTKAVTDNGLKLDVKKSEVMAVGRNPETLHITANGSQLKQVESFRYLLISLPLQSNGVGRKSNAPDIFMSGVAGTRPYTAQVCELFYWVNTQQCYHPLLLAMASIPNRDSGALSWSKGREDRTWKLLHPLL